MLCRIINDDNPAGVPAEVVALRADGVALMPLAPATGIPAGAEIRAGLADASLPVSPALVGRVINAWGEPIDAKGPLPVASRYPLNPEPLNPLERSMVTSPLSVGVRALDALCTAGEGQRLAIMSGAGVGKSTLLGMMARYTSADVTVVALIGERSREVKRFVEADLGPEGLSRSVVLAATSDTAAALRIRAAKAAFAIAEYFRDQGLRVLLLMDSLTRVCMAQRELGLAIGEPPTTRGYPPSAFALVPLLLERAGPGLEHRGGSITGMFTVLLEGDDVSDPIGDQIRSVTDGHVVLSRRRAERGEFPAVDTLASLSRVMPEVAPKSHIQAAVSMRRILADLKEATELAEIGAFTPGANPRHDRALANAEAVREFLVQSADSGSTLPEAVDQLTRLVNRVEGTKRA
jgi:flagellum-specific ATP synthase